MTSRHFLPGRFLSLYYAFIPPDLIIVHTEDQTERKRAEIELQKSEEKYRSLASVSDRTFVVDRDCRYLFANENYLRLFGPESGSVIGRKYGELHNQERSKVLADAVKYVFETGNICQSEHFGAKTNQYFLQKFSPIRNSDGSIYAVTVISIDITERKRAEEQLQASLREKNILLNEIHHRVKNNLQVISGLLYLQTKRSKNPEVIESFQESQNRIQAMMLVHEKLYHSKDFSRIDLASYVRSLSEELFQSYTIHPGKIDIAIQANEEVYVDIIKAVPCGLILNELISNALKHAFPEDRQGELQIIIRETKNREIEIVVRDNGVGLPDDIDIQGSRSLGLDLVTGFTQNQLDGQVEVKRDNGTEFRITFSG
jgi:PAS domain S-box-containing protein